MSSPRTGAVPFELPIGGSLERSGPMDRADVDRLVLQSFDEHARGLRRYVESFGLQRNAAEDIVQEAYLSLFRHLQLGRPATHLKAWLFRVGHNLALKHRARARRWQAGAPPAVLVDPAAGVDVRMEDAERRRRLQAVVRALPERDRRCLSLRAEGLSYRDIADVLGISTGSVAASLARAFARLARSEGR